VSTASTTGPLEALAKRRDKARRREHVEVLLQGEANAWMREVARRPHLEHHQVPTAAAYRMAWERCT
jgi:hypothetical protein